MARNWATIRWASPGQPDRPALLQADVPVDADPGHFGDLLTAGEDLALPYRWLMRTSITVRGQWMFPRAAAPDLINLARSGLLDLGQYQVTEFSLDEVNEAVAHAAGDKPFSLTVVRP